MTDTDIPYSERDLIQRAINSASSAHESKCADGVAAPRPRWDIVKHLFCCGSNAADRICWRYGFDPDGVVGAAEEGDDDPDYLDYDEVWGGDDMMGASG